MICGVDTAYTMGKVVQGRVSSDSIWFDLDNANWYDVGAIQGTTWSGTVNADLVIGGTPVTIAGNFTAVRQPALSKWDETYRGSFPP